MYDEQDSARQSKDVDPFFLDQLRTLRVSPSGSGSDPNSDNMRNYDISAIPSQESLPDRVERLPPSRPASLQDDVTFEASMSDKNSLPNESEIGHFGDDRNDASVLEPGQESNQPGNDALELQSCSDNSESGEKEVIQDISEPTLELGKSEIGGISKPSSDWNSRSAEILKETLEGNWEDREVGDVKDMSTITGLNIDTTHSISGGTPEDMVRLPSVETQLADLKDLIDNEIQPSLKTNHALVKEIHEYISNVDVTQTLAELQKRKDFIRREIRAVLQLRKEDEKRVIEEYGYEQKMKERKSNEERQRIIEEYERNKTLQAQTREELIMRLRFEEEEKRKREEEEWESFLLKQKNMEEEEKAKRKKAEEELEEAMRSRLAHFGFQANQIEAMVNTPEKKRTNPMATQPTHSPNHQPVFTISRWHRDHVDPDTLIYYDIPYKVDPDNPHFINILRDIEPEEMNVLFEHTRRLRTRRTLVIDFKTDHHSAEVKINPQLLVPPFLTWPTKFDDSYSHAGSSPSQENAASVELTLFAIEKQMAKKKFFIPDGPLHPTVIDQKLRADFAKLPERTLEDLDSGLSSTSWNLHLQSRAFQKFAPETAFIKEARQEAGSKNSNQILNLEDPGALSKSTQVISRRVLQWLLAHLCDETEIYVDTAQKLIDQFVPKHYTHPLLRRCWWCLEIIQSVCVSRAL